MLELLNINQFYEKKRLEEYIYTCNTANWTKKEFLNKSWDKMGLDVTAIWDKKE